jgi:hypothetical protein
MKYLLVKQNDSQEMVEFIEMRGINSNLSRGKILANRILTNSITKIYELLKCKLLMINQQKLLPKDDVTIHNITMLLSFAIFKLQ